MRDNKNLNKTKMALRFIPYVLMVLLGIFIIVVSILGTLEHYGVISNTYTILNFSLVGLTLAYIMAFCFIYFPIRIMIYYVKLFKNKSFTREVDTYVVSSQSTPINLVDVEEEHNRNLKQTNINGQTQQTNTKPNKVLIVFLSAIVGIFSFVAILCIINSIVP